LVFILLSRPEDYLSIYQLGEKIKIDGSYKSGSGTIVRDAVSLSVLTSQEIHLINIRAKREKPDLRDQHLKGVEACSQICQGKLKGAKIGSREIP